MEIPLKKIVFSLLFLVAALVLVNIFVIMPFLSLEPPQISAIQEEIAEIVEPDKDVVLRVDSLAVIRKDATGTDAVHFDSDGQTLRNPFFWPEEKSQPKKVKEAAAVEPETAEPAAKPESPKPRLSMVLISEGGKQALLDDVFIREGEMFHGYLVKSIQDNEVVLSDNFGDLSIFLGNEEENGKPGLPPGGVIEQ